MLRRRLFPVSFSLFGALVLVMTARVAPAKATRPQMRVPSAIQVVKLSMPIGFDVTPPADKLGIEDEDPQATKLLLDQASTYIDFRRGRLKSAQAEAWTERCERESTKPVATADPFCRYERERRPTGLLSRARAPSGESRSTVRHALINDLKQGRFEKAGERTQSEIASAVSQIESQGALGNVAERVVALGKTCVAPSLSYSLGYKLEERFPDTAAVDLADKLYRKASECGRDLPAAQASFRLGLLQIWKQKCDEVPELMTKVETTPEASAFHPRAKYWRYYCAGVKNDEAAKQTAKDELLRDHPMSFQTLAVCGDDQDAITRILSHGHPMVAKRSIVRADLNPMLRAAEALVTQGANDLAAEFFDRNVKEIGTMEPEVRLYAASVLSRIGFALAKFKILSDLFQDEPRSVSESTLKLYFPLRFLDVVRRKQEKVDPLLILSLIRQESAFNELARSIAGARGLMQVMPRTARNVASVRAKHLFNPDVNIGVGTKYFLKRLEQYGGDVELTLAAYNAGFARVDQWRKRYPTENKMLFLDLIPFRETRDYVSSILRNYYWYVKLYSEPVITNALEGPKVNPLAKAIAITSANAGAAASTFEPPTRSPASAP